jgi:hypothetical protein
MITMVVTFGLIIVIFYFLIIRPQRKKQKETQNMLSTLRKGDKVATAGGIRRCDGSQGEYRHRKSRRQHQDRVQ